jgi:hypothetical protein
MLLKKRNKRVVAEESLVRTAARIIRIVVRIRDVIKKGNKIS